MSYSEEAFNFSKQGMQMFVQEGDSYVPLQRSDLNQSSTSSSTSTSLTTAFGERSVALNEPFIQASPTQGFIPANFRVYTAGGGEGTVESGEFKIQTNTSVGGYGAIQSFRSVNI